MALLEKRTRDDPRREATIRAFLDATESLLAEGASFADLSVSRVADRAGRTRTAFYAHFEDRRALLLALLEDVGGEVFSALEPFLEAASPIQPDAVTTSISALLATFRRNAPLVGAVVEAAGYDEMIAAYWADIVHRVIDGARQRLEAEGLPHSAALPAATALVWMTERTCYQQALRGDTGLDDTALVAGLAAVWWSSLAASRTDA